MAVAVWWYSRDTSQSSNRGVEAMMLGASREVFDVPYQQDEKYVVVLSLVASIAGGKIE